jgi:excisionase family DNA binding protein
MGALGEWMTTEEAAQLTGYNPEQIRRLARAGKIKAQKWGNDWMIDKASLLLYIHTDGRGPQVHKRLDRM